MAKRLILKSEQPDGIPTSWEVCAFAQKHGVHPNEVPRLYVSFRVGKRRKLKRLRITVKEHPCDICGRHIYVSGTVGKREFDKEIF